MHCKLPAVFFHGGFEPHGCGARRHQGWCEKCSFFMDSMDVGENLDMDLRAGKDRFSIGAGVTVAGSVKLNGDGIGD